MSRGLPKSGQASAIVLVGLMIFALPVGLAVSQGLTAPKTTTDSVITPTLPPLNMTDTPTSSATQTPDGGQGDDDNKTSGNNTTGKTHFVNFGGGVADGASSEEHCLTAKYTTIQAAVDAAEPGDTVAVCAGTYSEHVKVTTANLTIRARGDAVITNANESAVWINAPGVTLQGFNISVSGGADYAIEVGGKNAIIRGNTVKSPLVGIFLSDGHTETGECRIPDRISGKYDGRCDGNPPVDPDLGAATGGRVENNTVSAGYLRIWVDADQTIVQNNYITNYKIPNDAQNYPECRANSGFSDCHDKFNSSIVSSGNDSVIRGNIIRIEKQPTGVLIRQPGIMIGKTPTQEHNMATNNTVAGNSLYVPQMIGIMTRNVSAGTKIRNNTILRAGLGIRVGNEATIRNNRFFPHAREECFSEGIKVVSFAWAEVPNAGNKEARIINNTIDGHGVCLAGMSIAWQATIKGNTIKNLVRWGIRYSLCRGGGGRVENNQISGVVGKGPYEGHGIRIHASDYRIPCPGKLSTNRITILNNEITNNGYGITLHNNSGVHPRLYDIHGNLINNNQELGIYNQKESKIVDATNNIWGCGGPSGGADPLADPYTGRLANGSGDLISAGNGSTRNGHEISNVHFDPFKVLASCSGSGPVHTTSPTATPTPTPTPTATPTPTSTPGIGTNTAGTGGNGTGGTGGNGTVGVGSNGETIRGDAESGPPPTVTPPPTSTKTPTETPIISPTPRVEPGFGVVTWAFGVAILVGLQILRRRTIAGERSND